MPWTRTRLQETCCLEQRATIWIWPGQAAYLGPSLDLDQHSGSVHCFALGVDAPFLLRRGDDERRVRSALIPARTRHQVVSGGGRMLFLWLSAPEVAAELSLSASRFLHLFSAQAGTSFRRYRLWARMLSVAVATAGGVDLTRASAEAGFASPSHFSDSFHDMFGLTASTLLAKNARVVIESGSNGTPAA